MAVITGLFRLLTNATTKTVGDSTVTELFLSYSYGIKKNGEKFRPSQTINASIWGRRGETMAPYLVKTALIDATIEDPHIEEYEGKNGRGVKLAGKVISIEFAGGKSDSADNAGSAPAKAPQQSNAQGAHRLLADFEDDIPF